MGAVGGWGSGAACLGLAVRSEPQSPPGGRRVTGESRGEGVWTRTCRSPTGASLPPGPSAHPGHGSSPRSPRWARPPRDLPCSSCATCRKFRHASCTSARSSPWLRACSRYSPAPSQTRSNPTPPPSDPGSSPPALVPQTRESGPSPSLGSDLCSCAPRQVARLLNVPTVLTEQYPQGLGPTVPELGADSPSRTQDLLQHGARGAA